MRAVGESADPPSTEAFATLLGRSGLPPQRVATFWVHPECVACFHYLGSMLVEAESQADEGTAVVFVVLGTTASAERLTRFLPDGVELLYDPLGQLFTEAGVTVTPQFLLFDAEGHVARDGRGPDVWGTVLDRKSDVGPSIRWTEVGR